MTGAIGLDIQDSRTAIAVLEWSAGTIRTGAVGDGRRMLVPHAWTGSLWGSEAAEAILDGLDPEAAPAADQLLAWRQTPWSAEFLEGLYQRLFRYLGQTPPTSSHGHQVCLCTDTAAVGETVGPHALRERLEAARLTEVIQVEPADALVCRWLADPAVTAKSGTVLAVACGEVSTMIAHYRVQSNGQMLAVTQHGASRIGLGAAGWCADIAAEVIFRCREGVPRASLLALLDGVMEFGAMLRAQPAGAEIEWAGPLAERMYDPLRVTREYLRGQPGIARVTAEVRESAARMLARTGAATPMAVLVGGPGAVWPFLPDAMASFGPVWQSSEPEADLAVGAAWWVSARQGFGSPAAAIEVTGPGAGLLSVSGEPPVLPGVVEFPELPTGPDADDLPPWKRDLEEVPPWDRDQEETPPREGDQEQKPPWDRDE
jgi:hypothetical protein